MVKLYTWLGNGYRLHECTITKELEEAINNEDIETTIQLLIDSEDILSINVDDLTSEEFEDFENDDLYYYIENPFSNTKKGCFFVLTENMKIVK